MLFSHGCIVLFEDFRMFLTYYSHCLTLWWCWAHTVMEIKDECGRVCISDFVFMWGHPFFIKWLTNPPTLISSKMKLKVKKIMTCFFINPPTLENWSKWEKNIATKLWYDLSPVFATSRATQSPYWERFIHRMFHGIISLWCNAFGLHSAILELSVYVELLRCIFARQGRSLSRLTGNSCWP